MQKHTERIASAHFGKIEPCRQRAFPTLRVFLMTVEALNLYRGDAK